VTTLDVIARLLELADRARRLPPPNHRNPHAFHEARSELGRDIELVAHSLCPQAPAAQLGKEPC